MNATFKDTLTDLHLLKHPFYQAWMQGTLSQAQLKEYAIQYHPHVEAFPRFVSAIHSRCEDSKARAALAHNLADEEGLTGSEPHPELWLRFAEGLGATREEVLNAPPKPAAKKLVDGFHALTQSSYAEGLAALYAYEHQVPAIASTKIDGLAKHYGISDGRTTAFFKVHEQADVYHSDACLAAIEALPPADREKAEEAGKKAAQLLWDFLSEAYA